MTFSTNEREFLRIAALPSPDWAELGRLGKEAMHWGGLRTLALQHQLDGVVEWRCVDERLDGIVPEIVRQSCAQRIAELDAWNQPWLNMTQDFIAFVESMDIRYLVTGGPAIGALYGTGWTRPLDHLDVLIHPDDVKAATDAMEERGWEPPDPSFDDLPGVVRYGSTKVNVRMLPHAAEVKHGCTPWHEASVEAAVRATLHGGASAMVPRASDHFASRARSILLSYAWCPERLTLGHLSEMHLLQQSNDFSWPDMWQAGYVEFDAVGKHQSKAEAKRTKAELDLTKTPPIIGARYPERFSHARYIAWAIEMVGQVYPLPEVVVSSARKILAEGDPFFLTLAPEDEPAAWFPTPRRLVCTWGRVLTAEDLLFEDPPLASVAGRLAAGWWRRVEVTP